MIGSMIDGERTFIAKYLRRSIFYNICKSFWKKGDDVNSSNIDIARKLTVRRR